MVELHFAASQNAETLALADASYNRDLKSGIRQIPKACNARPFRAIQAVESHVFQGNRVHPYIFFTNHVRLLPISRVTRPDSIDMVRVEGIFQPGGVT
jgi:hypothetical protein